ncbi:MAG: hypothetical protein HY744_28845 [Deltaproteobacteria bacterium]|nr:hypothetical protein [Deltaproteobacteria bacterium]
MIGRLAAVGALVLGAALPGALGAAPGCAGKASVGGVAGGQSTSGGVGGSAGSGGQPAAGGGGATSSGGQGGAGAEAGSGAGEQGGYVECPDCCWDPPGPVWFEVDIVLVIDNSASMAPYIEAVQDSINKGLASILSNSGIDYRVIALTAHGKLNDQSVCIEAPLSSVPPGGCDPSNPGFPKLPGLNPPRFFHYSVDVGSHDAWCKIFETYDQPDKHFFTDHGWQEWLRPGAQKLFVLFGADGAGPCSGAGHDFDDGDGIAAGQQAAADFDAALLALDPQQFGEAKKRRYAWHSIVGIPPHESNPLGVWLPGDPLTEATCTLSPGTGYQALSVLTQALRAPLCDASSFDAVYAEITKKPEPEPIPCEFPYPPLLGSGVEVAPETTKVVYEPGGGGPPVEITQVGGPGECGPTNFYIDDQGTPGDHYDDSIVLCEQICGIVQADKNATLKFEFKCKPAAG